jgi:16S rRNA (guanine966-N2)-methyltransferase
VILLLWFFSIQRSELLCNEIEHDINGLLNKVEIDDVRVIAGKAKGRRLKPVPGSGTRPITDRAKSALFSILGADVMGARFLDLFAGTGGVGIEALSRGADEVVFVERDGAALRTIRENLAHTGLAEGGKVRRADVFGFLKRPPIPFDYVYVAPPQYRGLWTETLYALDRQTGWLYEDGWVIVQIHPREYQALPLEALVRFDQRTYGSVMLCFYRRAFS